MGFVPLQAKKSDSTIGVLMSLFQPRRKVSEHPLALALSWLAREPLKFVFSKFSQANTKVASRNTGFREPQNQSDLILRQLEEVRLRFCVPLILT